MTFENLDKQKGLKTMLYKHETEIKRGTAAFGKEWILCSVPDCIELAGAGIREQKACYRIVYQFEGVRHSKAFKALEEAKEYFNKYTKEI